MCALQPARGPSSPGCVVPVLLCWSLVASPCLQAQLIAQSIGQAFSVAYQEFLRANGINPEDLSQKEYSDIINTQEMYNDDLIHFSNSENCKEVSHMHPGWAMGMPWGCHHAVVASATHAELLQSQSRLVMPQSTLGESTGE